MMEKQVGGLYTTARFILILISCAWLSAACQQRAISSRAEPTSTSEPTPAPRLDLDVEEYAVYADLLESIYTSEVTRQVLIVDQTWVEKPERLQEDLVDFQESYSLTPELVASFMERNQHPNQIEPVLDLELEYQLLTQEHIYELRPQDEASGWKLFYEKYPDSAGFIYLSRAGFSADLSQALVYYSVYRYEQPIIGGYYLMNRQDGQWVVEQSYEWIT